MYLMLDADLAFLYGVPTKRLNEQVKRNINRFPPDFMFKLTPEEKAEVVANSDILAFQLAGMSARQHDFEGKAVQQFQQIFEALRGLMAPPVQRPKRAIGFIPLTDK
jgi:hypothetical protein